MWGDAMGPDRGEMLSCAIPNITLPPIYGMGERQLTHDLVPLHLRENRGGGDGEGQSRLHGNSPERKLQ